MIFFVNKMHLCNWGLLFNNSNYDSFLLSCFMGGDNLVVRSVDLLAIKVQGLIHSMVIWFLFSWVTGFEAQDSKFKFYCLIFIFILDMWGKKEDIYLSDFDLIFFIGDSLMAMVHDHSY